MKIEHIYWFANFNLFSPSVRYRGLHPLSFLKKKYSIGSNFVYPSYKLANIGKFIAVMFEILLFRKKNSLIVIENIYTQRIYSLLLKMLVIFKNKYTLYDIDDAEYERFPPETIEYFIKKCSACSVGSETLMNYAKPLNQHTFLLTSPVIQHNIIKNYRNEIFTIGWVGFFSAHKISMYNDFLPSLKMLDIPIKLVILGVNNKKDAEDLLKSYQEYPNIMIEIPENIDWYDEMKIYERIKGFDIGISTLLDNELNRAKSAFKLKQYMSCGVPVLGTNIGENAKFLVDDLNGYICKNPNDFKDKILKIKFLQDEAYFELSRNARKTYYQFDMETYCKTLLLYFEKR